MDKTCNINKNHVLALYFHEVSGKEEQNIKKHVDQCKECQDYLLTLKQTDDTLHQWQDESPLPNTLDLILEQFPEPQPEPITAKPSLAAGPFVKIVFTILSVLGVVVFLHDKVTRFAFWEILQEWWFVRLFGSFGVTLVLFFLLGAFITLALSPVLIMESQSRKYRFYFS